MNVVPNNKNQITLDELKEHFKTKRPFILVMVGTDGQLYYCSGYANHLGASGYCWRTMEIINARDNDCHTATIGTFDSFLDRNLDYLDCMHFFNTKEEYLNWVKEF